MSIDLRAGRSTKEKKEILLAKSRFVASRHSRIKASASVADFSFDLATESCPFKNITSCLECLDTIPHLAESKNIGGGSRC